MRKVFNVVAGVLTVLAAITASTASFLFIYQPKVPKSLSK
ncbi:MAG: cyclic lactone autoinducer peptide [Clostridia bacterium]|nr:cyclic lactone autoinducer peptide [Clostridia bacterium]